MDIGTRTQELADHVNMAKGCRIAQRRTPRGVHVGASGNQEANDFDVIHEYGTQ